MNIQSQHLRSALLAIGASLTTLWAQGQITAVPAPGRPPVATTLGQGQKRTPISSAPYDIQASGSYYLTSNLTVGTGNAITIYADGVTVDLNGFTISSTAASPNGAGIGMSNGLRNLTLLNGSITSGADYTGGSSYSGTGFAHGVLGSPANCRASGLTVSGCLQNGIYLEGASVVESCSVSTVGQYGIVGSTVSNCVALECGVYGIAGEQVFNSRGQSYFTGGVGLLAWKQALNCQGTAASDGTGLSAVMAVNCSGDAVSNGTGLFATTARNCQGTSSLGDGLVATVAEGCTGSTGWGAGIKALKLAQNCQGTGNAGGILMNGTGIGGGLAVNCYGTSTGLAPTPGILARIATGCFGESVSGPGISAYIANSCNGVGFQGGVSATYKYDMP